VQYKFLAMPPITALLHTANDALRLGRALEMLLPCNEILIVDHASQDSTLRIAREYGARIVAAEREIPGYYLGLARHEWILCLEPVESITENLQASLYEWALMAAGQIAAAPAFSFSLREETADGWSALPMPQTRLVPRGWKQWRGRLPADIASAPKLEGELLRFTLP